MFDCTMSGSVLLAVLVHGCKIYLANIGHSRAVIVDKYARSRQLTVDHVPNNPLERKRVESLGGIVEHSMKNSRPCQLLWTNDKSLSIDTTRSIGDSLLKHSAGVSDKPEIGEFQLCPDDMVLVIGTNSIWKHVTNEKVATILLEKQG